jgi:hypothetical protein
VAKSLLRITHTKIHVVVQAEVEWPLHLGSPSQHWGQKYEKVSLSEPANIKRQMVAFYALAGPATLSALNPPLD